jgi:molybdate transport system substrate-binding protein
MRYLSSAVLALTLVHAASAEEVNAAVAANFTAAMKEIAANFEAATGHKAVLSFGSTGKLYAQIENGAPFDLFLAADRRRPMLLETQGVASGRFTYAVGKLVLWSPAPALADDGEKVLAAGNFTRLAIAKPETAPYGAAAVQVLKALGLYHALQEKLVRGENIAQTYQFVATQNAQLGFVALAQIVLSPEGSRWEVPDAFYDPIRQDAVLLRTGINKPAATALFAYLKSPAARAVIEKFGYGIE